MLNKIFLILRTVRYLKPMQLYFQVLYRLKKPGTLASYGVGYEGGREVFLEFRELPPVYSCASNNNNFEFLNLKMDFSDEIDWNYQGYGKLWNYNLQYGNYLLQSDIDRKKKKYWLKSLHCWLIDGRLSLEPYPVSLRTINTIRFLCAYNEDDELIVKNLYAELDFLSHRLEYHLLGNHLLENAFALMMGGAFFSNAAWLNQGKEILAKELNRQVLSDGGHFELSPMYHQIILFRLLELIDWHSNWKEKDNSFDAFLKEKASKMLIWLKHVTFANGDIPYLNDSAPNIAYSSNWLLNYGSLLNIYHSELPLSESGYRVFKNKNYECIIDIADIGPSYQPGHGHADVLSFIMYIKGNPIFVEQGTSTYQIGERRSLERATEAHNTVVINNQSQSEIWGGFRVGRRAKVCVYRDSDYELIAAHNGYRRIGIEHERSFIFKENSLELYDKIKGVVKQNNSAYFHLHPDCKLEKYGNKLIIGGCCEFVVVNDAIFSIETYNFSNGYNKYREAKRIKVSFHDELNTKIRIN